MIPQKQFVQAVDIFETDNEVTVQAQIPVVARDDIEINLEDNEVTAKNLIRDALSGRKNIFLKECGCRNH